MTGFLCIQYFSMCVCASLLNLLYNTVMFQILYKPLKQLPCLLIKNSGTICNCRHFEVQCKVSLEARISKISHCRRDCYNITGRNALARGFRAQSLVMTPIPTIYTLDLLNSVMDRGGGSCHN